LQRECKNQKKKKRKKRNKKKNDSYDTMQIFVDINRINTISFHLLMIELIYHLETALIWPVCVFAGIFAGSALLKTFPRPLFYPKCFVY
jgi:hypothetical protein